MIPRNLLSAIKIYNDFNYTQPEDHISLENAASIDPNVVHRVPSTLLSNKAAQIINASDDKCPAEEFRLSSLLKGCSIYISLLSH